MVDLAHAGFGAFDATAENDGKWLQDDRFLQLTGKDPLSDVQQLLEHKSLVLLVGDCIPQVLESVGRVPRLVLKGASEQDLFGGIVGEPFAIAIDGLDEQATQQVEQEAGFRPSALALKNHSVDLALALDAQAAAIGEGPLSERFVVASCIEHIGGEEQLDLVVAVGHMLEPVTDGLELDVGSLAQLGAELAHSRFQIVGQGFQGVPGDVRGWNPTTLDGFFVQVSGVVGPHLAFLSQGETNGRNTSHRISAARHTGLLVPAVGNLAVDSDVQALHRHAFGSRFHANAPLQGSGHPGVARLRHFDVVIDFEVPPSSRRRCGVCGLLFFGFSH